MNEAFVEFLLFVTGSAMLCATINEMAEGIADIHDASRIVWELTYGMGGTIRNLEVVE